MSRHPHTPSIRFAPSVSTASRFLSSFPRRDLFIKPSETSNQSVELTATRRALTLSMTKPLPLRTTLALGGGSSLLSRYASIMSRAYNLVIPLFVLFAAAWLCSAMFLQFSWATFCASVLHMSDVNIIRIHIVSIWLFLVVCIAFVLLHLGVLLVPLLRRRVRPRVVSHIAVAASLFILAVCAAIVSKPGFQKLYRVFHTQRRNHAMERTPKVFGVAHLVLVKSYESIHHCRGNHH
jgi:hypothetical protein